MEEILNVDISYKIWLQELKCNPHLSLEVEIFAFYRFRECPYISTLLRFGGKFPTKYTVGGDIMTFSKLIKQENIYF